MSAKLYDVIIAGAGPIGLLLACELGLAGVSVLVLERERELGSMWKTEPLGFRGLNPGSFEAFYRRGLLGKVFDPDRQVSTLEKKPGFQFGGHFAGILLNANKFDIDRWKYRVPGPALGRGPTTIARIEAGLSEHAESLGVTILRGHAVTGIAAQDDSSVTVEADGGGSFRGRWLVGCDGGRSVVRKAAGFDFVGTEAKFTGYAVKCEFDQPEKLKPGFHVTGNGMYILGVPKVLHLVDFDDAAFDRAQGITREHVQTVFERVSGVTDVRITTVELAAAFTDRCKQATHYRRGRVLLAGDAAHIHSPIGAQGLNLGIGDAMNLGWKLAATVRQESRPGGAEADLTLLDTYESERHPVGAWVLEWTRAQVSTLQPDPYGAAIRSLVVDLIGTTDGTNLLLDRVWGLSQRYSVSDDTHELVGCSAPDFEFMDGSRLNPKLEHGRGLFIDFEDNAALKEVVSRGIPDSARAVDYVGTGAEDRRGLRALLVRPDGVVVWVAEREATPNVEALKAALETWFKF